MFIENQMILECDMKNLMMTRTDSFKFQTLLKKKITVIQKVILLVKYIQKNIPQNSMKYNRTRNHIIKISST